MEAIFPPSISPRREEYESFVRRCVDVLVTLLTVYGFDRDGYSLKGTYDHWLYCSYVMDSTNPLKFVKWKLAAFYAAHKDQEISYHNVLHFDNPGVLLGGRAYKYIRLMNRTNKDLFETFITSVLYSKKGMPRPNKKLIEKSEIDAYEKLTQIIPLQKPVSLIDWGSVEDLHSSIPIVLSKDTIKQQIARTVNELFEGTEYTPEQRIEPFFPSTSANYINTRSMGGIVGRILGDPELLKGLKTEDDLIQINVTNTKRSSSLVADTSLLRLHFMELYSRMIAKAKKEFPAAVPLGLPEALKVRVISKGPPDTYFVLKPLQKFLWGVMKKHPTFKLIGQPVTADYIQERMGASLNSKTKKKNKSELEEDNKFLSVDYQDATNEMYAWVSNAVVKSLSKVLKLSKDETALFKKAMTGHYIRNPDFNGKEGEVLFLPQVRGQLMGSIVSFPILCIVNAAILRWTKELSSKRVWTLKDCPLAVNGDDGLLKINFYGKILWEQISTYCGLSPSIGKVYFSSEFLNINSLSYIYHPEGWEGYVFYNQNHDPIHRIRHFELIKYVNLGLLFNLRRSGGSAGVRDTDERGSLGSRVRDLVETSPVNLQERVLCQFLHSNRIQLRTTRLPWFIPEAFGGLGFPTVGKYQPSQKHLRLARMIYENPKKFPLPSKPVSAPWKVWQYATERFAPYRDSFLPSMSLVNRAKESISTFPRVISEQTLLGYFCIEALFRSQGISSLYQLQENNNIMVVRYFRRLERVWKNALHSSPYPEPFNQSRYPVLHSFNKQPLLIERYSLIETPLAESSLSLFTKIKNFNWNDPEPTLDL